MTDNGTPSLSATQGFLVVVNPVAQPLWTQTQFTNGQFRLTLTGDLGPDYTVQASTNLAAWTTLFTTNPPVLPWTWADADATNFPGRFYRIMLGP